MESGKIRVCATDLRRLWSKTGPDTLRIALKCLEQMARAQPAKNAFQAFLRRSPLILEHRREESFRSIPPEAKQELVVVG